MKRVRHFTGRLALLLTLAVAALLLPSSPAHAGGGHGGGHAGLGGAGHSAHHGHFGVSGGYGWTWGGYDPYLGYGSFYGGDYGYGIYSGNVANVPSFGVFSTPFWGFGVLTPSWGASPAIEANTYQSMNFMNVFP
jgi:hypothetical protein